MSHEWSPADRTRIQEAYAAGGAPAARAAFPDRSEGSVLSAVRRYALAPKGAAAPIDGVTARRRLSEIPVEYLVEPLCTLMTRRSDYIGARP